MKVDAAVLANPEPHIGKVYDLTGPPVADDDPVRAGVQRRSRTIKYVTVPPHIWETKLQEANLPAHLIAHLNTMGQLHRENRYDRMTDSFKQLVGRAPISAAEFARRHADAFAPQSEGLNVPTGGGRIFNGVVPGVSLRGSATTRGWLSGHLSRALLVASHVLLVFDHLPIQM